MSHTTVYVTNLQLKLKGVSLDNYPNVGPNSSITGMKQRFWGKDCFCLKNGNYVFKVPQHIYEMFATGYARGG